mmetsp:Transcript_18822/g.38993  ORF Transcript_18822/g.38993 Transcript_18822/m.38993 type:complete len:352 (-) Transcript_18822:665-1720(-)|eukprot:CAMPEP_0172462412 /NCGR_PEP_ID=MMETSP1065-20121228/43798_1 /TAXON_ID=265537 /ORGANISM="Amphiprora paludosa, Strain CCMP125" /LENGTH=351 /DNA_ID=CAMNT_0013218061 /DNA_START=28 /DNA_END=1083 /DNA_ORIENTATION=-
MRRSENISGPLSAFCWTPRRITVAIFGTHLALLLFSHNLASAAAGAATVNETTKDSSSTTNTWASASLSECWEQVRVRGPLALGERRDQILFISVLLLAFELLDFLTKNSGKWWQSKQIPVRGKHLDELTTKDIVFIGISKAGTAPFVYWYLRFIYSDDQSDRFDWDVTDFNFVNTFLALCALFVVYDFFYTALHWFLHIKSVYGWVHKHHHVQKAPSRANVDAVNVHPVEFILGEYNHLWALFLVTRVMNVHFVTTIAFLGIGGFLAGLNHTRFDVVIPVLGWTLYDSKVHDVHHRIPQSNYGQYIMLWDHVFGTFRSYNPNDRVNPDSQLDPKTGKTVGYESGEKSKSL